MKGQKNHAHAVNDDLHSWSANRVKVFDLGPSSGSLAVPGLKWPTSAQ